MSAARPPGARALAASAAAALVLQGGVALLHGAVSPGRVGAVVAAALLVAGAARVARSSPAVRSIAALGAPALLFAGALEARLAFAPVLAAGLLLAVAAALVHATLLLVLLAAPRALRRATLLLAAVATAAFLGEVAVRAFVPVSIYDIVPDDRGGGECIVGDGDVKTLAPGFRGEYRHPEFPGLRVEINDLGLRDGLDERAPAAGERSVLVLGDSFVFGTGVEVDDTFHERLERRAAELDPERRVRVYGAGVPGYGQVHAETALERLAPRLRPDVVVVAVYEGNDLEDNMKLEGRRLGKVSSIEEDEAREAAERRTGRARFGLAAFVRGVRRPAYWLGASSAVQLVLPGLEERLVRRGWIEPFVPANRMVTGMLRKSPPPYVGIGRAHLSIVLGRLRERCDALGAAMVVLLIPAAVQADERRFERFVEARPAAARDGFERRRFHDRLAAGLRADGHVVLDPIDRLEEAARDGDDPYLREGHWSAAGHRIAAELLLPAVSRALLRD
ncbi:MAG: hypothetical protein ACF8XB_10930 [Planctomycetota bacterium JB042]